MSGSLVNSEIIDPYAQGLMSLAKDQSLTDRFGEDAAGLLSILQESAELNQFLGSPLVGAEAKKSVLRQVASESLHPYMLNFLMLLIDRGRISLLTGVLKQYQSLLRDLNKTVLAEVTSAIELTDEQKESVRQKVLSMTEAQGVDLETQIDPDLLGGVIIKVGSQVVDASLRSQLRRIGLQLGSAA
ncbi:MAG: F0F1 ATP synthase subunit delta [Leptolyngbya sp. SIO4C5]|uniref:ATP synthase F1 subunit delta n=1 Tax=Sphaerothrix gracilis TaxID=3151835 RepID=UPI0013BF5DAD|nr:F0F1 ATP synthase subunit delta [Leptolyngbya sp. SIO4C5]